MTDLAGNPSKVSTPPTGSRRLLVQLDGTERVGLVAHRRHLDPPHPARRPRNALIAVTSEAGLRGRGGAGFPTGTKMRAVADQRGRPVVVVNGTEGEPASRKDALLLSRQPHLVLDGAVRAALAVGADEVLVCIDRKETRSVTSVREAIDERVRLEPGGPGITVLATPPRYVAGEETALIHWINGGEARPTVTPPRPFEKGVRGRPTLVDNVETLAHLAQIAQYGSEWFRGVGTTSEPGTALITLSVGGGGRRSVHEVPIGTPLAGLMERASSPDGVRAALVGGYFGSWLSPADLTHATLSDASLRPLGGGLGCGAVVVLPEHACGVVESARVLRWMAGETAGQCGPCVHGLHAIASCFEDVARGTARGDSAQRLHRWAGDVEGRGACRFPDGAVRFLRSAMRVFAEDLHAHSKGRPCRAAAAAPILPIPLHTGGWR